MEEVKRSAEHGTPAAKRQNNDISHTAAAKLTMQLTLTFPDADFPDVVFEATVESLVKDVVQAAADEWGIDAKFLEISFAGSAIPLDSRLMSHEVEAGSELTVSMVPVYGLDWFTDSNKREKLMQRLSNIGEQELSLDAPTFTKDGCFQFTMAWIQTRLSISFVNVHPSITSVEFSMPGFFENNFPVTKVDLSGFSNITLIGNNFLSRCSVISVLDVSCLSNVTSIGNHFLSGCSSLSSLDLTAFINVTSIGNSFLSGCSSLSSLDLKSFGNLTSIGKGFLFGCSGLSTLNLECLSRVTLIGRGIGFIKGCSSLTVEVEDLNPNSLVRCRVEKELGIRKPSIHAFA
eukprot:TRINITY_DN12065_c0_g1_i1.p1 TRINITY_DN12065_c0_g1~~TRINITY_DN12065_c0_g1_i1.p1  ORF type:complete len:346 (+),score=43.32 TRINITY_DN12065_c0_g1_i1:41-1078(+)